MPVHGPQPLAGATPPHATLNFSRPLPKKKLTRRAGFEPLPGLPY